MSVFHNLYEAEVRKEAKKEARKEARRKEKQDAAAAK